MLSPFLERVVLADSDVCPAGWSEAEDGVWGRSYKLYAHNGAVVRVYAENKRYRHGVYTLRILLLKLGIPEHQFLALLSALKTYTDEMGESL